MVSTAFTRLFSCRDSLVHFVDLGLEVILGHVPLQLECAREQVVLDRAELRPQDEVPRLLKRAKFLLRSQFCHVRADLLFKIRVFGAKLSEIRRGNAFRLSPFHDPFLLWDDNCNDGILERVSVDEALSDCL